jgi:predicted small lipoprotein YifL
MRSSRWALLVLLFGLATACPKKGYLRPDAGVAQTHHQR